MLIIRRPTEEDFITPSEETFLRLVGTYFARMEEKFSELLQTDTLRLNRLVTLVLRWRANRARQDAQTGE